MHNTIWNMIAGYHFSFYVCPSHCPISLSRTLQIIFLTYISIIGKRNSLTVKYNWPNSFMYVCFFVSVITGFETANKYEIKNALGQRVYFAAEENDCCTLNCCGPSRPFTMKIMDNMGREVINLMRPLRCSSCCFPCCLQEVTPLMKYASFGKPNLRPSQ